MGRPRKIDSETLADLVDAGRSVTEIAAALGVTRRAVQIAMRRHSLRSRNSVGGQPVYSAARAISLRKQGATLGDIADLLGCHLNTVRNLLRRGAG